MMKVEREVIVKCVDDTNEEYRNLDGSPIEYIVRCRDCKWYQGAHGVQGHAPCEWLNKQVLWNSFCSNGEPYKGGEAND